MQGLWSTHRKTKLNLNATVPSETPVSSSDVSLRHIARESSVGPGAIPVNGDTLAIAAPASQHDHSPEASSSKRKVRSSRTTGNDPPSKRQKGVSGALKDHAPPTTRLSDLGGVQPCVEKMLELVAMPLCH